MPSSGPTIFSIAIPILVVIVVVAMIVSRKKKSSDGVSSGQKTCPHCRAALDPGAQFCAACGKAVR